MNRAGLFVALAVAVVSGVVFGVFAGLDVLVARRFLDLVPGPFSFSLRFNPTVMTLRDGSIWLVALLAAPAVAALALKIALPRRRMLLPGRAAVFLLVTLALGPGVIANGLLKEYWGRPRPIDVVSLGGNQTFVAWWDPRGNCPTNCSFVSGDISSAFWTLAPAALAPPAWRALTYGAAVAFGIGVSLLRMAAGAHFVTDAIFAGVFTFLIAWAVHGALYRWPRTRLTDDDVEHAIERVALPPHDYVLGLFGRRPSRTEP
jgi:membrane-associated PAP2 superfamily phosphatase